MTTHRLWVPAVLAVLAAVGLWVMRPHAKPVVSTASAAAIGYQPGDLAPDFALRSLAGATTHLSDYRGHVVLLNFWATWCAPCRVEMPWLVEFDRQYRGRDLHIVGVNLDDPGTSREAVAAFARDRSVDYLILMGNNAVADSYGGVRFMPQTFFIGPDGKVLKSTYGITTRKEFEHNIQAALAQAQR